MNYSLKSRITIQGITVQVVCSTVGNTFVSEKSVFVSRQVTPVAIIIQGEGRIKTLTLDGKPLNPRILETIHRECPAIRDSFN